MYKLNGSGGLFFILHNGFVGREREFDSDSGAQLSI